jgi:hypothetical protein
LWQIKFSVRNNKKLINDKFKNVFDKNKGFEVLQEVSNILSGDEIGANKLPEDLSIQESIYFKYAAITSVDVERSFSIYKNLSSNRRSFEFENLKKSFFVQCNHFWRYPNIYYIIKLTIFKFYKIAYRFLKYQTKPVWFISLLYVFYFKQYLFLIK